MNEQSMREAFRKAFQDTDKWGFCTSEDEEFFEVGFEAGYQAGAASSVSADVLDALRELVKSIEATGRVLGVAIGDIGTTHKLREIIAQVEARGKP